MTIAWAIVYVATLAFVLCLRVTLRVGKAQPPPPTEEAARLDNVVARFEKVERRITAIESQVTALAIGAGLRSRPGKDTPA